MIGGAVFALLLGVASPATGAEPSDHTIVYYNARMALREGHSSEAIKLWLLRNALENRTGQVSPHDADFQSVTWAALGNLGICQDGTPTDEGGAGLWPLALHNWVIRNAGRRQKVGRSRPFDAFQVGRQQRFVSITDVLSAPELETVNLFRGPCLRPRLALVEAGERLTADLSDRQVAARLLRALLDQSRQTLARSRVRGMAAIDARLFDLDLQLTALAAQEARLASRAKARKGRQLGLSRASVDAGKAQDPTTTLAPGSQAARILRECVSWPVSEWMTLSPDRRRFLFDRARAQGIALPGVLDELALGMLDEEIALGEGEEVEQWIGRVGPGNPPAADLRVWDGDRGQRLLALDREETGFRERATIALHRGVGDLERGELAGALRSLAYALQHAPESRDADDNASLSRRWLGYVAGRFELSDELLVTLRQLVPSRDYAVMLEDLMWRAAFHADAASFERGLRYQAGRGALDRRLGLLRPLATGDVKLFSRQVGAGLGNSPSETMRFLDQLVQRLEREDAGVRTAQLATLRAVRIHLAPLAADEQGSRRIARSSAALVARCQAIEEGLVGLGVDAGAADRARSLSPSGEVFAGSVRLAPTDTLPWPFRASEPPAPSVFMPLQLTPVEWRDPAGELVFGWRIGG